MSWLNRHLDHPGRERIDAALKAADETTSGEIIPVLARRSAGYGHVPWLAAALCLAAVESAALTNHLSALGHYVPNAALRSFSLASACVLLGWLLSCLPGVRRALTPSSDRALAVHRAAEAAFHRLDLRRARGDAGVLLYVSLEERRAVVLAGGGIADLAGPEHWKETCRLLTHAAAQRDLSAGFEQAINHAAQVLARHHPSMADGAKTGLAPRLRVLH